MKRKPWDLEMELKTLENPLAVKRRAWGLEMELLRLELLDPRKGET